MKKIIVMLLAILLVGCTGHVEPDALVANDNLLILDELSVDVTEYDVYSVDTDGLRLSLYIDKKDKKANEHIEMFSTIEYIGDGDYIAINYRVPLVGHVLSTKDIDINSNVVIPESLRSKIDKDKIYVVPFVKNGGYSSGDPDFIKDYFEDDLVRLPQGGYTVEAFFNFWVEDTPIDKTLKVEIDIE